jgi:hypothetical protein
VSDPWDSLTEEEYIEDILENFCGNTDYSDYEPKQFDIFGNQADDNIGHYYQGGGKTKHCIVIRKWMMSSSDIQRLTVERRSNVVIPRDTTGKAAEQYQPITNRHVPTWAVELYNRWTAGLDGMEALVSESISKAVNVQQEMPQLVDAYMWMVSKQNTFHDAMTSGVEMLCHNVYAQYTEIILQSQVFASYVKGGMTVIAAKASQDYENVKDAFHAQILSNHNAWTSVANVLMERQDAENKLAGRLEAQKVQIDENRKNAETIVARVQTTLRMEMKDNTKKAGNDLRKQWIELASTKREMKANTKQWLRAFAEFQKQLEEKLKEVPRETRHSIRSLAESVADDAKPTDPEWNPNQPKDGIFMPTWSGIRWVYRRKNGKWEIVKDRNVDNVSLPPSTPPSSNAGCGGEGPSGGGGGGGGVEEAIIIGLVTQMSHRFPHSPLATTHMIVQVHQTAETNPEGVA